jgi:hypothetical protein
MKNLVLTTIGAAMVAALMLASSPALAHHSHAMFDGSKETEITGVVTNVRYANPHVYLQIRATHRDGMALEPNQTWAIEMSTIQNQTNRGLTRDVTPVGATISIKVNPLFSGGFSGNYTNVVMINGVKNTSTGQEWKPAPATR